MKTLFVLTAIVIGCAAPVLAEDAALTCAAYNALDDAGKQALAPQVRTLEPAATMEPLKSQDDAELITSTTQACSEYPSASISEALSQLLESSKMKG